MKRKLYRVKKSLMFTGFIDIILLIVNLDDLP